MNLGSYYPARDYAQVVQRVEDGAGEIRGDHAAVRAV
jgi:hypothetical protein